MTTCCSRKRPPSRQHYRNF